MLFGFAGHARRSLAVLVAGSVVAGFTEGAAILVVVRVAVELASVEVSSSFVPFITASISPRVALAIATGFALVTLFAHVLVARQSADLAARVLENTRERALTAFTRASWTVQSSQRLGALQETVGRLAAVVSDFTQIFAMGIANLIMLVMFLLLALTVNPLGMIGVIIAGGLLFVCILPIARGTRRAGTAYADATASFNEDLANFGSGAMEVRAFGVGEAARGALVATSSAVAAKGRAVKFMGALGTSLYRDVAVLLLVGSVAVLTLLDQSALGSVSAVVVLVVRALASAHAVNAMVHSINEQGPSGDLLASRIAELEAGAEPSGSRQLSDIGEIEFRHVSYRYPSGNEALHDLSFTIGRGEVVGVFGASGGGKSTLLQVLLRLRRPTSGAVLLDGVDYGAFADHALARAVAFVPQEPTLFEGTIAENIAFFRPLDRATIEQVAVEANVADEISALPAGFDTSLGPGGSGLSGGQKQRVAIARALAGRPDLLVLDEPSSALDPYSEQQLTAAISRLRGETTVIVVAHRESTLRACTRLVEITAGRVTAGLLGS